MSDLRGQTTDTDNTGIVGKYLGWNASQNFDLRIRHDNVNEPIVFATDGQERMQVINQEWLIGTMARNHPKIN